jgi:hypothetical protein
VVAFDADAYLLVALPPEILAAAEARDRTAQCRLVHAAIAVDRSLPHPQRALLYGEQVCGYTYMPRIHHAWWFTPEGDLDHGLGWMLSRVIDEALRMAWAFTDHLTEF